jgi:hypothetical protein
MRGAVPPLPQYTIMGLLCLALFYLEKGKGVPVLFLTEYDAMKAYWVSGGIAPLIL